MRQFRLTIKSDDKEMAKEIMKHLYQDFELLDEPDECNKTLGEYLTERQLKDLSVFIGGNDLPSTVKVLEGLKLVGDQIGKDDFCSTCGSPEWYYTGGRMLCNQCEHSEEAPENYLNGDIADYSGFVSFNKNK